MTKKANLATTQTEQKFTVVERDVFNPAYVRVVSEHATEDAAWQRVGWLTKSYSGGGMFYEVRIGE